MATSLSRSGGYEGSSETLTLDSVSGAVIRYSYEHYSIPDRFQLLYEGKLIFDTGFVGGGRSGTIKLPTGGTSKTVQVIVATDDVGTAWDYSVTAESVDTYPFILKANGVDFVEKNAKAAQGVSAAATGLAQFEGSGLIDISRADGTSAMHVDGGKGTHDGTNFTVSGAWFINGITDPIFTGSFGARFDNPSGAVTDKGGAGFKLGGLDIAVTKMAFNASDIRMSVDFQMPGQLGSAAVKGASLVFTDGVPSLGVSGKVAPIPDGSFNFFGFFDVTASKQTLSYDHTQLMLKYQGELKLDSFSKFFPTGKLTLNLGGDNYVGIKSLTDVHFKGDIKYAQTAKFGTWGLKELKLSIDTDANQLEGSVTVGLPMKVDVQGTLGFTYGPVELNSIGIAVKNIKKPIPYTPFLLQDVGGKVENIAASDPDPVSFTGDLRLTAGPKISGKYLVDIALSGTGTDESITGTMKMVVVNEDIFVSTGSVKIDWSEGISYTRTASVKVLKVLNVSTKETMNSNGDFSMAGTASITVPSSIKFMAGKTIASANYIVSYTNDNTLANDFLKAWYNVSFDRFGITIDRNVGFRLNFDGTFHKLGFDDLDNAASGGSGSAAAAFALAAFSEGTGYSGGDAAYLYLTAQWTVAHSGNVELVITHPDGTQIAEADFAAYGIDVIEELGSTFGKVVAIQNPGSGNWNIGVVDDSGLGTVTYSGSLESDVVALTVDSVGAPGADGYAEVGFTATDGAEVTFYYDDDATGNDGQLMNGFLQDDGTFIWDTTGVAPGAYYVYGVAQSGQSAPVIDYSPGTAQVTAQADLSIEVVGPAELSGNDEETVTITVRNNGTSNATNVLVTELAALNWHVTSTSVSWIDGPNGEPQFLLGDLASGATTEFTVTLERGGQGDVADASGSGNSTAADAFELGDLFEIALDSKVDYDYSMQHASVVSAGDGTTHFYKFTAIETGYAYFDIDDTDGWESSVSIYEDGILLGTYDYGYAYDEGSGNAWDPWFYEYLTAGRTYTLEVRSYDGSAIPDGVAYRLNVSQEGGEQATGPLVYTASVDADQFDPDLEDNIDFDQSDALIPNQTTDLAVSINTVSGAIKLGDTITRTITLTNNSASDATGVQLYGSTWGIGDISLTPSQGAVSSVNGDTVIVDLGDIAAGQSATIVVTGKAFSAGEVGAHATVVSDQVDISEADNELIFTANVAGLTPAKADLELAVTTSRESSGMQVVNLNVANQGPGLSSGITVLAPQLLGSTTYGSSGIQGIYDPATGIWNLGSLRDGISRDMVITLDAATTSIGLFRAQIKTADMEDPDSSPGNGKASEDDQVQTLVALGRLTLKDGLDTADTLQGTDANEVFYAKNGDDKAFGGKGDDAFLGGGGKDNLAGQDGNDWFHGGAGNDTLNGGRGSDTATFVDAAKAIVVRLDTRKQTATGADIGKDKLASIENAVGGSANDVVKGSSAANVLDGMAGNDNLSGGGGKDNLTGGLGRDTVSGGAGKDTVSGGAGKDLLMGGADADAFVFDAALIGKQADVISDFVHDSDVIQLDDAIFAAIGTTLQTKEFYAGAGAVKGHDRNDRIVYDTSTGKLYYDADGSKAAIPSILIATLTNKPLLDAGDFAVV